MTSIHDHLPLKPVEFLVLAVLSDGHRHGYGIVREMKERTSGVVQVRPGDLYASSIGFRSEASSRTSIVALSTLTSGAPTTG